MLYLRYFLFAALIAASVCLGGQYVISRNRTYVPLWLARYTLSVRDYQVLAAQRTAGDLPQTAEKAWRLYESTRSNQSAATQADQFSLAGWVDALDRIQNDRHDPKQYEQTLHILFVAAELMPNEYNTRFQQQLELVHQHAPALRPQADLFELIHRHQLQDGANPQLLSDLAAFAANNPTNSWGVDLFVTVAGQLRENGFVADAEQVLALGQKYYATHPQAGRLYRTLVNRP